MPKAVLQPQVFLIDDDDAVRNALRLLLSTYDFQVQAFASADAFLKAWNATQSGCLVLDLHMPGMSGFGLQEIMRLQSLPLPVIFITGHGELDACRRAFRAGAVDFLTKPVDEQALVTGIRNALASMTANRASQDAQRSLNERIDRLSSRERDILQCVIDGLTNKQIADQLGLSSRTIEAHRAHIASKLEVTTLADLIRVAVMAGYTSSVPEP